MTNNKIASQVAHAIIGLGVTDLLCTIIVLGVSDTKFNWHHLNFDCYVHEDLGYTEVLPGTKTCLAYYEER
jgi:peptidyl-tRNA hydrolase